MGDILSQLRELFVQSIPTVIFVFLLLAILERLFFRPLTKVLKEREEATLGALDRAREQAAAAEAKSREYEAALQAARLEVYRLREVDRRERLTERDSALKRVSEQAEGWLKEAQADLANQLVAAKQDLGRATRPLAEEIADAILGTRVPDDQGVAPN